jgi:hypothetical protein
MPSRQPADAAKKPKLVGHSDNAYSFRPAAAPGTSPETNIGMATGLLARSAAARLHASTRDTSNPTLISPQHVARADRFPTALSLAPPARTSARTTLPSFLARSHPTLPGVFCGRPLDRRRLWRAPTRRRRVPPTRRHKRSTHRRPTLHPTHVSCSFPSPFASRRRVPVVASIDSIGRFPCDPRRPPTKHAPHRIRFRMDACRRRQQPRSSPPLCGGFTGRSRCPTFLDAVARFGIPTGSHTGAAALVPSSVAGLRRAHYQRGGFPPSRHCQR